MIPVVMSGGSGTRLWPLSRKQKSKQFVPLINNHTMSENQPTYISIDEIHALKIPGIIPLEMIEVQSGSYLSEDDIVCFDDRYGGRIGK